MAIDFRVQVDWTDNGWFNDAHTAAAEDDPLNILTTARMGTWTLGNAAIANEYTFYGLDYAQATNANATVDIASAAGIGEISVSANTTYRLSCWINKTSASDNAQGLFLIVRETSAVSSTVLASTFTTARYDSHAVYFQHTVSVTTTASTAKVYLQVVPVAAGWVGTYRVAGLMVTPGTATPVYFNDGVIKLLTHRVIDLKWNVGFKTSVINGAVANENRLECSLYNADDYIDESKYGNVHRVYIDGTDDGFSTVSRLYTGWTREWHPIFDTNNPDYHMRFTAVSSRFYMDGAKARLPMQEGVPSHTIMTNLANAADLPDGSSITMGIPRAGDTTYNFSYAGDNWDESVDLLRALADTAWGDGRIVYFDRYDELLGMPISSLVDSGQEYNFTLNNYFKGSADYRYGSPWVNRVEMRVSPRKLGASSTARLWELPDTYDIGKDEILAIQARFNDEDKPYQLSARNVTIASQTFSGPTPTVALEAKSNSAYITIDNTGNNPTQLTAMRLEGQKVKSWDSYYEQLEYDSEIVSDGNNTLTINSRLPDDVDRAQGIMESWLDVFGTQHHRLWSISSPPAFKNGDESDLLEKTIGVIPRIMYPDGVYYKHMIIGEEWMWKKGTHVEKRVYLERIYTTNLTPIKPSAPGA